MLDAVNIRCFSFWRQFRLDDVFDEVVEKLQKAVQMAKTSGHTMALENEHNMIAATGVELAKVVNAVGKPLTAIYDLGNSWQREGVVFPDDMYALKGLISHIHVKHESIDIVPGNNTYGDPLESVNHSPQFGGFFRKCYGSWALADHKIDGKLNIDGVEFCIIGERTLVPVTKKLHYDHRAVFKYLRKTGFNGLIAVDSNYICPQAEENARGTLTELQKLIEETWS
jgi:sugar phosphate isomerase/epimerase